MFKSMASVKLILILCIFFSAASLAEASSKTAGSRFSISPYTGLYYPHLDFVNSMFSNHNYAVLQDANYLLPRNEEFLTEKRNMEMNPIKGRAVFGIIAEWSINDRYAINVSISSWEGESWGEDMIAMFTRSNLPSSPVPRESRYLLLINDIVISWKYKFLRKKDLVDLYLNFGLLGYSSMNFTMDALIKVDTPQLKFASMSSTEAKGDSLLLKLGGGGDFFLKDWLSIGGSLNYVISMLVKMKTTRLFMAGYPNIPPMPPEADPPTEIPPPQAIPEFGDSVSVSSVISEGVFEKIVQQPVNMRFQMDGFEFQLAMKVHF